MKGFDGIKDQQKWLREAAEEERECEECEGLRDDVATLKSLVSKLDEYIALMDAELNETAGQAVLHGWQSSRVNEGILMRKEIAALRGEVT